MSGVRFVVLMTPSVPVKRNVHALESPRLLVHCRDMKIHEMGVVPRSLIVVNPERNARKTIEAQNVRELSEDIAQKGMLEPVGVREISGPGQDPVYELVYGTRRLAAADLIGAENIPVVFLDADDALAYDMMLAENLHREEFPPWELGAAVLMLHKQGKSLPEITRRLSLVTERSQKAGRLYRLAVIVSGLHPEIMELWKRNLRDFDEDRAYELSQRTTEEQEAFLEEILGTEKRRPPPMSIPGARVDDDGSKKDKPKRRRRPNARGLELAYRSLKQHDDDPHDDGYKTSEERKIARALLQWAIGGRGSCPIKLRKYKKLAAEESEAPAHPQESVPIRKSRKD